MVVKKASSFRRKGSRGETRTYVLSPTQDGIAARNEKGEILCKLVAAKDDAFTMVDHEDRLVLKTSKSASRTKYWLEDSAGALTAVLDSLSFDWEGLTYAWKSSKENGGPPMLVLSESRKTGNFKGGGPVEAIAEVDFLTKNLPGKLTIHAPNGQVSQNVILFQAMMIQEHWRSLPIFRKIAAYGISAVWF